MLWVTSQQSNTELQRMERFFFFSLLYSVRRLRCGTERASPTAPIGAVQIEMTLPQEGGKLMDMDISLSFFQALKELQRLSQRNEGFCGAQGNSQAESTTQNVSKKQILATMATMGIFLEEEKKNKTQKTWPKEAEKRLHISSLLSNLADILQPQILHNTSTPTVK